MNLIKTKSFELAVNTEGDRSSEKLAIVLPGRLDTKEVFNIIPEPKILHELNCRHDYRYYPGVVEEINQTVEKFIVTNFSRK